MDNDFGLVRYNSNGGLDNSFDADGLVTTDIGGDNDTSYDIAIQGDGKILVAGSSHNGSNRDFAVARYYADGSLDDGCAGSPPATATPTATPTSIPAGPQYYEKTVASFTDSSSNWVNVTGGNLTFTPSASSEIWILLFSARLSSSTTTEESVEVRYLVNDVEHGYGGIQNSAASMGASWQHFYRIAGTTAQQNIQVQLRNVAGTGTIEDLQIIAFKLPDNADFQYAETEGIQYVTGLIWASYQDLSFTPSSAGVYLIMAVANGHEFPGAATLELRLQDPVAAYWPVDSGSSHYHRNPRDPWQSYFVSRVYALLGAQTYQIQASGPSLGSELRFTRIMAFRTDAFDDVESVEDVAETSTTSTSPVVKSILTTGIPPASRDYIVIQSMTLRADTAVLEERRAGFEADDVVEMSYSHVIDNFDYTASFGFFDAKTTSNSIKYENTFSTSINTFTVYAKESVIHVLRLPGG
ncbi:MAG: hypothetical protein GTO14_03955 [Anaerolineales bacterium]|nr:hypothetical protein [Anaerolineales bacterium]